MGALRHLEAVGLDTVVSLRSSEPSGHLLPLSEGPGAVDCQPSRNPCRVCVATQYALTPGAHERTSLVGPSRAGNSANASLGCRIAEA